MSWGLGWKRPSDIFHLSLYYGTDETFDDQNRSIPSTTTSPPPFSGSSYDSSLKDHELGFRIDLDWNASEDDVQVALRLQSQVMVALPLPQDTVVIKLFECDDSDNVHGNKLVCLGMEVVKQRDPLKAVVMSRVGGSGQHYDGMGVFSKLMTSDYFGESGSGLGKVYGGGVGVRVCGEHWMNVTVVNVYSCGLSVSFLFIFLEMLVVL